jgi:hypothetical protein
MHMQHINRALKQFVQQTERNGTVPSFGSGTALSELFDLLLESGAGKMPCRPLFSSQQHRVQSSLALTISSKDTLALTSHSRVSIHTSLGSNKLQQG